MRYSDQNAALLGLLRQRLKQEAWTSRKLAAEFGVGEATTKRWLAGKGLTLDKLTSLAALCNLSLADLVHMLEQEPAGLAQELTLAQERALGADNFLSFLFIAILGGNSPAEIADDFHMTSSELEKALVRLDRLALIDRRPSGRVIPLVDRALVWRKKPMRSLFEARMKPLFMEVDFSAEEAVYASEIVKLSARGLAMFSDLIESFRRDVQNLAKLDRKNSSLPRGWYTTLSMIRPIDLKHSNIVQK